MEVEAGADFGIEEGDFLSGREEVKPVAFNRLEPGLAELSDESGRESGFGEEIGQLGCFGDRERPASDGVGEGVVVDQ